MLFVWIFKKQAKLFDRHFGPRALGDQQPREPPHQVLPLSFYLSVENIPLQPTKSHHSAGTRERAKSLDLSHSPWLQLAALPSLQHPISC